MNTILAFALLACLLIATFVYIINTDLYQYKAGYKSGCKDYKKGYAKMYEEMKPLPRQNLSENNKGYMAGYEQAIDL